jgi:hypothetical protein
MIDFGLQNVFTFDALLVSLEVGRYLWHRGRQKDTCGYAMATSAVD